jgi:superoxide dismutase, Cu-Zn family
MDLRKTLLSGLIASTLALSGSIAVAQEGTPDASPAATPAASPVAELATPAEGDIVMNRFPMATPDGKIAAFVDIWEGEGGVTITVTSTTDSSLASGTHGIHIHEVGACDASGETPYESSGGHFNPTDASHGDAGDEDAHAGDLGNLEVAEDGTIAFQVTTDKVTLDPAAENSLAGPSGASIIIHAEADDLETDPSGESGERVACGIIFRSVEPAMNIIPPESASPEAAMPDAATPDATPAS